jgi:hypothetical protein
MSGRYCEDFAVGQTFNSGSPKSGLRLSLRSSIRSLSISTKRPRWSVLFGSFCDICTAFGEVRLPRFSGRIMLRLVTSAECQEADMGPDRRVR